VLPRLLPLLGDGLDAMVEGENVYVAQNEGCATTFTWRQAGYASKFDQKKEKTKFIQW
jgi:hypothetical protein